MPRTVKRFLTPGWIGFTLFAWAAAVTMVLLGRWQLRVSNSKHFDLQNFGYTLQWWAFSAFAILFWLKAIRDTVRGRSPVASTGGALVVRDGPGNGVVPVGPAELTRSAQPGGAPLVYRGYVMPQSSTRPAHSEGDPWHASYNDYLWQLALTDSAVPPARSGLRSADPTPTDGGAAGPPPADIRALDPAAGEPRDSAD